MSFTFHKDVTVDTLTIPSSQTFILDENEIMGPDTGALFNISRIGNAVIIKISGICLGSNVVQNDGAMLFNLPDALVLQNIMPGDFPFCVYNTVGCTNEGPLVATILVGNGVLLISPFLDSGFVTDDTVTLFPTSIPYVVQ